MTTTPVIEAARLERVLASAREESPAGRDSPAADRPELIRALAEADEDELPLFGRLPG